MSDCKSSDEWLKELNDIAIPLGYRVVYKWWSFHLYKKERYIHGLESINDIKNHLKKEGTESLISRD